ncbi:MAG: PQQ-binding-like beta-propeller repeat protein [Phycisphaerales bacterium]|nr:PQQ-binding-like beta-propeller repeat protein [Phycisphaerales bacterium]
MLWSSYVDEMDPQLEESSARGPALFEGDLAVIAVRKVSQSKRFASAYLVGIDLADGSARWVRLAGSAGWLAYGGRGQWSDWPTLHEGIVYRTDELGVICAIEAGTGRYRWVRKLAGVESRLPSPRLPWASSRPVIDGNSLLTLSPDRRELLRIDLETGAVLASRDTRQLGQPGYIFEHAGRLVAVAPSRIASMPLGEATSGPVSLSDVAPDPGFLGRVVASGNSLLAPFASGVAILDAGDLREGRAIALDAPGNLLPLDDQLIAADNEQLHSYLGWEKASQVLRARLDADPSDVSSAISYAELAARAGHAEAVLEPIDRALAAMAVNPIAPEVAAGQHRLFELLLALLNGDDPRAQLTPELASGAVERLGAVAMSSDERATHLLVLASVRERGGRINDAVEACQRVLLDAQLAAASWNREGSSVRAEVETISRLDGLLRTHGLEFYQPFEHEAGAQLDRLEAGAARPEEFESLARSYPRSTRAPEAWLRAAEGYASNASGLRADRAYSHGIEVALAIRAVGLGVDLDIVGELVGRRVSALLAANRLDAAGAELSLADQRWPGLSLTTGREQVDRTLLESILHDRVEAREARPLIGSELTGEAIGMDGWALMRALDRRDAYTRRDTVLMLAAERLGAWAFDTTSHRMVERWGFETKAKPSLVRRDAETVLLFEPDDSGGTLRALASVDGAPLWRSAPLGESLARAEGAAAAAGGGERTAPLDGRVRANDLVLAVDETVIAVVSRSGRVVGIDTTTGREVWSTRSVCQSVHDAVAGDGVLVLAGTENPEAEDQAGEPVVSILDLGSGEELSRFNPSGARVRWVLVGRGSGRVVVGLSRGLVCLSLPDGQVEWTLSESGLEDTTGGWIFGDRLFLQTQMLELALIDTATGSLVSPRLDAAGCLDVGAPIDAVRTGDLVTFLSPAGCAMLDARTGERVGADALEPAATGLVQPVPARDSLVLCEREPIPGQVGVYRLHLLDGRNGRALSTRPLVLEEAPRRIALLDGVILLTTDDQTVVLPTTSPPAGSSR